MATSKVSDDTFEREVLQSTVPVVVDFWAEWCGPCRQIGPSLEEISKEMGGKVKIVKMNVDENSDRPNEFNIRAIPSILIFNGGKVIAQKTGALPKRQLQDWINGAIAPSA